MIEVSEDKTQYEDLRRLLDKRLTHPTETTLCKTLDILKRLEQLYMEQKFAEFLKDTDEKESMMETIREDILDLKSLLLKENIRNGRNL